MPRSVKQSTVILSGVAVALLLAIVSGVRFGGAPEPVTTAIMVEFLGVAIGSFIGSIASPGLPIETDRFKQFAKLAAAFATGYVLRYLEPSLTVFFKGDGVLWSNGAVFFMAALFATSAISAGLFMYVFRTYTDASDSTQRKAAVQKVAADIKKLLEGMQSEA